MKRALGVNIDHVATIRQARGTTYPSVLAAATLALQAGADQITVHLREDRRHIQDHDVILLRALPGCRLNLEMAATPEMLAFALAHKPDMVTLVPERRAELTTEGGLNVAAQVGAKNFSPLLEDYVQQLEAAGIEVSFFIDPEQVQLDAVLTTGATIIELHTGEYAHAFASPKESFELSRLKRAAVYAEESGLLVAAGHGLHKENLARLVQQVPEIKEYNIGHAIVARAVFVGLEKAIKELKEQL